MQINIMCAIVLFVILICFSIENIILQPCSITQKNNTIKLYSDYKVYGIPFLTLTVTQKSNDFSYKLENNQFCYIIARNGLFYYWILYSYNNNYKDEFAPFTFQQTCWYFFHYFYCYFFSKNIFEEIFKTFEFKNFTSEDAINLPNTR